MVSESPRGLGKGKMRVVLLRKLAALPTAQRAQKPHRCWPVHRQTRQRGTAERVPEREASSRCCLRLTSHGAKHQAPGMKVEGVHELGREKMKRSTQRAGTSENLHADMGDLISTSARWTRECERRQDFQLWGIYHSLSNVYGAGGAS